MRFRLATATAAAAMLVLLPWMTSCTSTDTSSEGHKQARQASSARGQTPKPTGAPGPRGQCLQVPEGTADFITFRSNDLEHLNEAAVQSHEGTDLYMVAMTFEVRGLDGQQRGVWATNALDFQSNMAVAPANDAAREHFVQPVGGGRWTKPPASWPAHLPQADGVQEALGCLG
jgi:hypothetical protein